MLILTRNVGQSINIGDDIEVTVLEVRGLQVRIGINAPKEVSVHREEIYLRIAAEKDGRESAPAPLLPVPVPEKGKSLLSGIKRFLNH